MARKCWRVQQWRTRQVVSEVEEVIILELVNQPLCATCAALKKWNEKLRRTAKKRSEMSLTVPHISHTSVHKILRQNLEMKKVCWKLVESFDARTEERTNKSSLQKCFWTIVRQIRCFLDGLMSRGFWNMICPQSISQCSGRGATNHNTKKLAWLSPTRNYVNFIFQHLRHGDGGMGAVSKKCRLFFYIETL